MSNIFELYRRQNNNVPLLRTSDSAPPRLPPALRDRTYNATGCSSTLSSPVCPKNAAEKISSLSDVILSHENDAHELTPPIKKMRGESGGRDDVKGAGGGEISMQGKTMKEGTDVHIGHYDRHPVLHSEELNKLLLSSPPITVTEHIALPNGTPTVSVKEDFQRYLNDPMQIISTINARVALQAFASEFIRGDTVYKIKSSSATSPKMTVRDAEATTLKTTPPSHGKQLNRVKSVDGKRYLKSGEGGSEMVSVPPRRRSAPKMFSPAPYLSSYRCADESPSMKRKERGIEKSHETMTASNISHRNDSASMVDITNSASSSSSSSGADSRPMNDSAMTRSAAMEHSEDNITVEAEVLSIEEKKLLIEVLNLCRNHVREVDTNDRTWFSQLKLGVLLQVGELRRKINHATAKRNELREKCRQLHRKCEACKQLRQVPVLPVAFKSNSCDGSSGGGNGQQAVTMQPNRDSSSWMRGQWIKVPQSSHNQQQMAAVSAFESETHQPHTKMVRLFGSRMRMQMSKRGRSSVTVRLARSNGGMPMPQRRQFTQLYNIADPNVIIDRNAQTPSVLSNSIPSR
uniref:Uncharacterized protein n=3 Tax=Parascaris univalens TaxID=6257 RepID=A0A915AT09_PARUN